MHRLLQVRRAVLLPALHRPIQRLVHAAHVPQARPGIAAPHRLRGPRAAADAEGVRQHDALDSGVAEDGAALRVVGEEVHELPHRRGQERVLLHGDQPQDAGAGVDQAVDHGHLQHLHREQPHVPLGAKEAVQHELVGLLGAVRAEPGVKLLCVLDSTHLKIGGCLDALRLVLQEVPQHQKRILLDVLCLPILQTLLNFRHRLLQISPRVCHADGAHGHQHPTQQRLPGRRIRTVGILRQISVLPQHCEAVR
mmetsp:Transcript_67406/g.112876  ORF Transcript_67406/g.112876 Transcript_67406/m.112876 type:complete len:252 (+) Transcript_67406:644-1399(+)